MFSLLFPFIHVFTVIDDIQSDNDRDNLLQEFGSLTYETKYDSLDLEIHNDF